MSAEEAAQRLAVVEEARSWLRTPYRHQARIKGVGVDCAMLLCEVYQTAGLIPSIDPRPYPPDWHLHRGTERYLGWVLDYGREVDKPRSGDVVVFKFGRCFAHGGIVAEWPQIVHAYRGQGCVLADAERGELAVRERRFFSLWS